MIRDLPQVIPLFVAAALGAAFGLERELNQKAAGVRTNILICLGACIFTLISRQMGSAVESSATRIAAHIVGGIGFPGAGVIIQDRGGVQGITTTATKWLVPSVGVSCGVGLYCLAFVATALATLTLLGLVPLERKLKKYSF
jgi:putative Mg2+ transporter-C (MgtC) family protein